jgi:integrase
VVLHICVSCYALSGLCIFKKLKRSKIIIGVDGEQWLVSRRQKTDISARIPLFLAAFTIIANTKAIPLPGKRPGDADTSNQKMNAYLKEIADACGIQKTLTYHIARHTFATTITLTNGVPIETVSKMLGHRNLRTTQHYAKILDKKIGEDMKGLRSKFT